MLKMIKGCCVPDCSSLKEEYKVDEYYITANVNADKIENIFRSFIEMQDGLMFFILELPTNEEEEKLIRQSNYDPFHKDIYYIDGLSSKDALALLMRYSELLINDGLSSFGFGLHDGSAEIMLEKYNQMTIWTNDMAKYIKFFDSHNIHITDNYISAWDTFTINNGGVCKSITADGITVYDLPEILKEYGKYGMYFAERREE